MPTPESVIYTAIIGELEDREAKGMLQGNAHHLAQKLARKAIEALDEHDARIARNTAPAECVHGKRDEEDCPDCEREDAEWVTHHVPDSIRNGENLQLGQLAPDSEGK